MSSALAVMEPTHELWTADPSRTTVEFEVQHLWGLHAVAAASTASTARTSSVRKARRSS